MKILNIHCQKDLIPDLHVLKYEYLFSEKMVMNDHLVGIPLMLLANKQDLMVCIVCYCLVIELKH